jgi:hypothetical protein
MINKGRESWRAKSDAVGQVKFVQKLFGRCCLIESQTLAQFSSSNFATEPPDGVE